eukprot:scaffold126722_cov18-Tisochrysis_lutea.AAC.2
MLQVRGGAGLCELQRCCRLEWNAAGQSAGAGGSQHHAAVERGNSVFKEGGRKGGRGKRRRELFVGGCRPPPAMSHQAHSLPRTAVEPSLALRESIVEHEMRALGCRSGRKGRGRRLFLEGSLLVQGEG